MHIYICIPIFNIGYKCLLIDALDSPSSGSTNTASSQKRNWTTRTLTAQHVGPTYHRRGSLQLWQFLLALLNDPSNQSAIVWTGRGMEFKLIEPEEVSYKFNFKFHLFFVVYVDTHFSFGWDSILFFKKSVIFSFSCNIYLLFLCVIYIRYLIRSSTTFPRIFVVVLKEDLQ